MRAMNLTKTKTDYDYIKILAVSISPVKTVNKSYVYSRIYPDGSVKRVYRKQEQDALNVEARFKSEIISNKNGYITNGIYLDENNQQWVCSKIDEYDHTVPETTIGYFRNLDNIMLSYKNPSILRLHIQAQSA